MSYPRQDSTITRLHDETVADIRDIRQERQRILQNIWLRCRKNLQTDIMASYRWAAPTGRWDIVSLLRTGAWGALHDRTARTLNQFYTETSNCMRKTFSDIKGRSAMRYAWVLDQVTPESRTVTIPKQHRIREASSGPADWDQRWSTWIASYQAALTNNLRIGALNNSDLQSAMEEVDVTRAGSPGATIDTAMDRIVESEAAAAMVAGEDDILMANEDLVEVEIWRTRGDLRVCDDCDENEGLTAEETDGDIPLHPHCHCFWEIVPVEFAELLRSGDASDQALAREMDYRGLAGTSMAIRDAEGRVGAKTVVEFDKWAESLGAAVMGR